MTWFNPFTIEQAQTLHFAHFTDCHLFADDKGTYFDVNCANNLRITLDAMAKEHFDFVVFGGDLTQDHSVQSYQLFADLVAHSALSCPVFWVPGNHDEMQHLQAMSQGQINPAKLIVHPYAQVLLINTKGTTPAGWVEPEHLAHIETVLKQAQVPQLVIGHHHPMPVAGYIDKHMLDNGAQLLELLSAEHHNVQAVVHGHAHNCYEHHYQGVQILGTPATSIQFTKHTPDWQQQPLGPAYRTVQIDQSGTFTTQVKWLAN